MSKLSTLGRWVWAQPWLLLPAAAFMFGAHGTVARLAIGEISPLVLVCGRWAFVAVFVSVLFRRRDWEDVGNLVRTHRLLVGWIGLLGYAGFNALFYVAAEDTSAINLTLLQSAIPPFVLAGSAVVFRTRVRLVQLLGMACTFLGVLLVAAKGDLSRLSTLHIARGDALVLLACAFYAAYALGLRTRPPVRPMVFFAAVALSAFLWSVPMAGVEIAIGRAVWPGPKGLGLTFLIALGPSFVGQLCFMRGVDLIGPARSGLFANLIPIFGALTAVVVLHESFTIGHALAVVLGLGGISLAEWPGRRRRSVGDGVAPGDAPLPQADQRRDDEFHGEAEEHRSAG